jgi:hypothetical protein
MRARPRREVRIDHQRRRNLSKEDLDGLNLAQLKELRGY